MIEVRLVKCNFCGQRLWVPTNARTTPCLACRQVNSLPDGVQVGRVFHIRNPNANPNANMGGVLPPRSLESFDMKPRKRALLCGVSYNHRWRYKLKGTIRDVWNMRELLINTCRFPEDCVRQLTEEEQDPSLIPTRRNIQNSLQWLVEGCRSGDSLVFYFAGHGAQQPENETDGDEADGSDEAICPVDFEDSGKIFDNYINATIVRPLKKGVTLHAVIDSCHSATMLDLPYIYNALEHKWENINSESGVPKGTQGGLAICISACKDHKKAIDSSALSGKTNLTNNLIQELKRNTSTLTYGELLTNVQTSIYDAVRAQRALTWVLRTFFKRDLSQEIQLSSSEMFDISNKEFKL